jgi:hypothetical protein
MIAVWHVIQLQSLQALPQLTQTHVAQLSSATWCLCSNLLQHPKLSCAPQEFERIRRITKECEKLAWYQAREQAYLTTITMAQASLMHNAARMVSSFAHKVGSAMPAQVGAPSFGSPRRLLSPAPASVPDQACHPCLQDLQCNGCRGMSRCGRNVPDGIVYVRWMHVSRSCRLQSAAGRRKVCTSL